jgi:hypothetical protein
MDTDFRRQSATGETGFPGGPIGAEAVIVARPLQPQCVPLVVPHILQDCPRYEEELQTLHLFDALCNPFK